MKFKVRFLNYWAGLFGNWGYDFPFVDISIHSIKSGCSDTDYVGSYESTDYVAFFTVLGFGLMFRISTDMKWKEAKR